MKRFASVMLMMCILAVPSLAATYYAAPGGTGTGKTVDSPSTAVSAVALCGTGGTVQLADGVYRGPAAMVYLTGKVNIVVRAANDGAVLIDGEGVRQPVKLDKCVGVIVEGVDACNSNQAVVEAVYCYGVTFRRICAWDAAEGNNVVLTAHWSSLTTFEDCAGWGRGRKIMTNSQNCNGTRFIRCWGRWEGCISVGPKHVYEGNYNSYNCRFINCIGTWDTSTGRLPDTYVLQDYYGKPWTGPEGGTYTGGRIQSAYGIFAEAGYYAEYENTFAGTQFLGCMAYTLPEQTGKFTAGFFITRVNGQTVRNCHSSMGNGSMAALLAANDRRADRGMGLSVNRFAGYGGSVRIDKEWTPQGVCQSMPLPKTQWKLTHEGDATCDGVVDVGDLGVLSANWGTKPRFKGSYEVGDFNRDGNVDVGDMGVLSANFGNSAPLWPWPMEDRIAQAMVRGGYPAISVTHQVEQAFGQTLVPEEPPVSTTTTLNPITGGAYRYISSSDTAVGETWTVCRNGTSTYIALSASDTTPTLVQAAGDSENESYGIQRSGLRFSLSSLEGKVIQSISFRCDASIGNPSALQVVKTGFLAGLSDPQNFKKPLAAGTGLGTLALVSGSEYKVDLPAQYEATIDLALLEHAHDWSNVAPVDETYTVLVTNPRLIVTWSEPAPAGPPAGTLSLLGVGR